MLFSDAPYYFPKGIAYIFNVECENHNGCKRSLVGVEILDEMRVSLSRKDERLIYILYILIYLEETRVSLGMK